MSHDLPDLRAVLFLGGPCESQTFVLDVRHLTVDMIATFDAAFVYRYDLRRSSLGPEGWVAVLDRAVPVKAVPMTQEQAGRA